jgi:glycerophosphoryl diester phosphodiesterase
VISIRRAGERPLVVGHRGAASVAPANSVAALEAAVAAGADLVEFDVGPDLRLAHSPGEALPDAPTLDEALELLASRPVGLHVDVKAAGYEAAVVAAVRRHGLGERVLVSTAWAGSARTFAALAPELQRAIGYPRDRYGVARLRWPAPLTQAGAAALRGAMPARVPLLVRRTRATALALHHTLCGPAAVAAAHRCGVPVLGWTANAPADVRRLAAAGVDAVVSDDPAAAFDALATLFPL